MVNDLMPRPLRILLADDNRDAADTLAWLLGVMGHAVRVAYDGEAAWELAAEWPPDVCVLDIAMPRLDGYDLARRLRSHPEFDGTVLIALSAYSDEARGRMAAEAGFDLRFVKPVDLDALEHVLADLHHARSAGGVSR